MPDVTSPEDAVFGNARFVAKIGKEDELKRRLRALAAASRHETGNISYHLFQSKDQPSLFYVQECWRGAAALLSHRAEPHVRDFMAMGSDLLAEPHAVGFGHGITIDEGR